MSPSQMRWNLVQTGAECTTSSLHRRSGIKSGNREWEELCLETVFTGNLRGRSVASHLTVERPKAVPVLILFPAVFVRSKPWGLHRLISPQWLQQSFRAHVLF